mmetsp:Transcript_3180/g.7932  ORF Transcript_3180/g.7932 Transcript_3180/m.7932 type:complete len:209 (+) Transcript_3180:33-659(+)
MLCPYMTLPCHAYTPSSCKSGDMKRTMIKNGLTSRTRGSSVLFQSLQEPQCGHRLVVHGDRPPRPSCRPRARRVSRLARNRRRGSRGRPGAGRRSSIALCEDRTPLWRWPSSTRRWSRRRHTSARLGQRRQSVPNAPPAWAAPASNRARPNFQSAGPPSTHGTRSRHRTLRWRAARSPAHFAPRRGRTASSASAAQRAIRSVQRGRAP